MGNSVAPEGTPDQADSGGSAATLPRPPLLIRGSVHPSVREAQSKLNVFHSQQIAAGAPGLDGAPLALDGIFGDATSKAVVSFQKAVFPDNPAEWDGKIGPHTWEELDKVLGMTTSSVTVTTTDDSAPDRTPFGEFNWAVQWVTNATSGFIVQEIRNTLTATNSDGNPDTSIPLPTPHFWEAWSFEGLVLAPRRDFWVLPARPNTSGNWRILGNVYFVKQLDPGANFVPGGVPESRGLSTRTQPNNLGPRLMVRHQAGHWELDGTHVPR